MNAQKTCFPDGYDVAISLKINESAIYSVADFTSPALFV